MWAIPALAAGTMVALGCKLPARLAHQFQRPRNVAASAL